MSRQNRVNPGMYTQRGRLSQDDAARELARQRAIGSPRTWQPVKRNQMPKLAAEPDEADNDQDSAETSRAMEQVPARAKAAKPAAAKSAKPAKRSSKPASGKATKTVARKTAAKKSATARKRGKARTATTAKPMAKAVKRRKS